MPEAELGAFLLEVLLEDGHLRCRHSEKVVIYGGHVLHFSG